MSRTLGYDFNAANFEIPLVGSIPKKRLHQYQEQRPSLEFSCKCIDGEVKFSRYISETSGYFDQICEKREPFKSGPICYDGTESSEPFSVKTVKTYWDLAHAQKIKTKKPTISMPTLVDLLRFLQYEDKNFHEEFDKKLHDSLWNALLAMNMKTETKLLVAVVLSTFDKPDKSFEMKLTESVPLEELIMVAFNWDSSCDSNKELVQIYGNSTQSHSDEVNDILAFNVVTYTRNNLSVHYKELTTNQPIEKKTKEENKNETEPDCDIEVTGDTRTNKYNVNGKYKVHGEMNGAKYYKRIGSEMFVYREKFESVWRWCIHFNFMYRYTRYITDDLTPPETNWQVHDGDKFVKSQTLRVRFV